MRPYPPTVVTAFVLRLRTDSLVDAEHLVGELEHVDSGRRHLVHGGRELLACLLEAAQDARDETPA